MSDTPNSVPDDNVVLSREHQLAITFHETYERLAPSFGYETRKDTKRFDETTPNGKLMIAVCKEVASQLESASMAAMQRRLTQWRDLHESATRELTSLRSSLDAANATVTEFFNAGEVARHERNEMAEKLDAANRALAEARKEKDELGKSLLLAAEIFGERANASEAIIAGRAIPLKPYRDEIATLRSQLTEVRAKLEAAEKERDDLKLLHSNLVSAVNELWLQLENWGFIPCNDGWLGAVIKMHAQLTAAQAHVSRLQSDKPFTCFKCGTDDPQMMCPNCANSAAQADVARLTEEFKEAKHICAKLTVDKGGLTNKLAYAEEQLTAAASREAALVEALKNSRVILEEGEPQQRHLDGPVPTKEEETRHSTYWIRHQVTVAQIDAALARCSPPAAERKADAPLDLAGSQGSEHRSTHPTGTERPSEEVINASVHCSSDASPDTLATLSDMAKKVYYTKHAASPSSSVRPAAEEGRSE